VSILYKLLSGLIRRMLDTFNHIIDSCCFRFDNTITLAVIIWHKPENWSTNEGDDSEV